MTLAEMLLLYEARRQLTGKSGAVEIPEDLWRAWVREALAAGRGGK